MRQGMNKRIDKFKCDYETTVINARKDIFPEVHLTGCHYHFSHAVHKKAHLVKLDATPEGREIIKLCANLPLLPGGEIWKVQYGKAMDSSGCILDQLCSRQTSNEPCRGMA